MFKTVFKSCIWIFVPLFLTLDNGQIDNFIKIIVGIIAIYLLFISIFPVDMNSILDGSNRGSFILNIFILFLLSLTFIFYGAYTVGSILLLAIFLVLNKAFN